LAFTIIIISSQLNSLALLYPTEQTAYQEEEIRNKIKNKRNDQKSEK